MNSDITLAALC